jgi:hypothetical protein
VEHPVHAINLSSGVFAVTLGSFVVTSFPCKPTADLISMTIASDIVSNKL